MTDGIPPFVSFSNMELAKKPTLNKGDEIDCPKCGGTHKIKLGISAKTGKETDELMFYKCGDETYLAGIKGRCVMP